MLEPNDKSRSLKNILLITSIFSNGIAYFALLFSLMMVFLSTIKDIDEIDLFKFSKNKLLPLFLYIFCIVRIICNIIFGYSFLNIFLSGFDIIYVGMYILVTKMYSSIVVEESFTRMDIGIEKL